MALLSARKRRDLESTGCELRFDGLNRHLYATDASNYRVEPCGVAFPRSVDETSRLLAVASAHGIPIIPRGAGTGLAGGAIGEGLVVELARHNRWIDDLDLERRTVRVGAGVVLDQLNNYLAPHGLMFGPDVATSSRATLGGMVANNSSGAHSPVWGTTADHLVEAEVVLADGRVAVAGGESEDLAELRASLGELVQAAASEIEQRLRPGLVKRWPGYALDRILAAPGDLSRVVAGSEGTLVAVASAVLRLVERPTERSLAVLFFDSVAEAMSATVELADLEPAAVEHLDRLVFDQTRGQPAFAAARQLLRLDGEPCAALLLVEFIEEGADRLAELARRNLGRRRLICTTGEEQALVWHLRKAGLNLLTACKGPVKPVSGIEDVCVEPGRLPEYVAALQELIRSEGIEASFYGHAASGTLHVRPKLDLHTTEDVARLRRVADGVSELCRRFGGSLAAEHGVGLARTEYLDRHLGTVLTETTQKVKILFDPAGMMNPGKVVDTGRFRIDADLRLGPGHALELQWPQRLGFVERDKSFVANLEQCNGCGQCRKDAPLMCPTFLSTGEEIQSTRGRANTIRAALEQGAQNSVIFGSSLDAALQYCLSCKGCKSECPSNVDLALLKAELGAAQHRNHGTALADQVIAAADTLGRLGSATAPVANLVSRWPPARALLGRVLGLATDVQLPAFAADRFDHWFERRGTPPPASRGTVLLWDDTWVRYHEPEIGRAAVKVLEAAGFQVQLVEGRRCCGRPAFSRGLLEEARWLGEHNLGLLRHLPELPLLFLEPSCYSMFVDEYRQLGLAGADRVAERCWLLEAFLLELLDREPGALLLQDAGLEIAIHAHCHAKALTDASVLPRLAGHIDGASARLLDTGCCGMAGAYGMMAATREMSLRVAGPLVEAVGAVVAGTRVVATGTSCRHQIRELTAATPEHMVEILASAIRE